MLGMTTAMIIYKEFSRNENQTYEKSEMSIVVIDGKDNITLPERRDITSDNDFEGRSIF